MFCSKCGNRLSGGAFCPTCGAPAPAMSSQAEETAPEPPGVPVYAGISAAPSSVSPHWRPAPTYAGFWLRFVAAILDGLILSVLASALTLPLLGLTGIGAALHNMRPGQPPDAALLAAILAAIPLLAGVAVLVKWLYFAYCESSEWQATPGKKVLNLRVTDLDGQRISFGRASGRFFGKIISSLTMMIGYIMAGFTERRQALHDMIAGTLVLHV